jgi:thymidine phosphorylase
MSAVEAFDAVDLIRTKRDRGELSTDQIDWLVDAYTRGSSPTSRCRR